MKRRWRLLVCLGLLLAAVGTVLHPAVHWRLVGWAKGEAFYQGRPTSWWADSILAVPRDTPPSKSSLGSRWLLDWLSGPPPRYGQELELVLVAMVRDRDNLPLLLQLHAHEASFVRFVAVTLLGEMDPVTPEVTAALVKSLDDSDQEVSAQAAKCLRKVDPEAAAKAGVK